MTKWEKIKKRVVIIFKEIGNIITNVLTPIVSVLIFILGFIPGMPMNVILVLKQVEYWLFYASGTMKNITEYTEKQFKE